MFRIRRSLAASLAFATFLAAAPAHAVGVDPGKATPVQREQAQSRFLRGRELFTQQQYARALEEFQASHEIVASPNTRLFIARCLRELGKLVAAYSEFGRAAVEAKELSRDDPRYVRAGESAEDERKAIAPRLGFFAVTVDHAKEDSTLRVSGEVIRRSGWSEPIPAAPGNAEVALETPGREPIRQTVPIAAGQTKALSFDADSAAPIATANANETPPPAPPPPPENAGDGDGSRRGLRTASYVSAGVGGAGLVTFAIFGALSNAKFNDLKTACQGGPCPPARQSDINAGKRDQTIANVGLVVGLVGVAAAVTLFVVSMPKKTGAPQAAIVLRPGGLGVEGAF